MKGWSTQLILGEAHYFVLLYTHTQTGVYEIKVLTRAYQVRTIHMPDLTISIALHGIVLMMTQPLPPPPNYTVSHKTTIQCPCPHFQNVHLPFNNRDKPWLIGLSAQELHDGSILDLSFLLLVLKCLWILLQQPMFNLFFSSRNLNPKLAADLVLF